MAEKTKTRKIAPLKSEEPSAFTPAQIKQFVLEVKTEFLKIVWPNRKTTLGLTGIVVTLTVILSLYLGSVDLLLGKIISSFLQ